MFNNGFVHRWALYCLCSSDEVQQLCEESLLYLRRAVGSLLLGFPGETLLLLVERLGLQDHLFQLKRRVAVQSPLLRWTQTLRHRLFADIFMHCIIIYCGNRPQRSVHFKMVT